MLAFGVLAVMTAQLFGIGSGFLCDCSGALMPTASDHCHGPHDADCHDKIPTHHADEHVSDGGDMHSHLKVEKEFRSPTSPVVAVVVTEPLLQVVFRLDDAVWVKAPPVRDLEYLADERGSPPSSVALSRTVVLLI